MNRLTSAEPGTQLRIGFLRPLSSVFRFLSTHNRLLPFHLCFLALCLTGQTALAGGIPPTIDVDPASLQATLPQGQSEPQTLTIANLGGAPLTWEMIEETFGGWVAQDSGTTLSLSGGVSFFNANLGIAVGATGLRTEDGGQTWVDAPMGSTPFRTGVSMASETVAVVVANDGAVRYTTDGGQTWEASNNGITNRGVSMASEQIAIAVGFGGAIRHTADGGQTWTDQNSGTTNDLLGISMASEQVAMAVGDGGTILRTEDGGQTWTAQGDVSTALRGVSMANEQVAMVVGDGGIILRTEDGGQTWESQNSGTSQLLLDVHMVDAEVATVVGLWGMILRTENGGKSWVQEGSGVTGNTLNKVFFIDAETGWATGGSGTILHRKAARVECEPLPEWVHIDPIEGSVPGGNSEPVEVTFDTTGLPLGDYQAELCLLSNDPDQPVTIVPLSLTVAALELGIAFSPSTLDFGDVFIDSTSAPQSAALHNVGEVEITGLNFDLPGNGFDADTGDCGSTLPVGASCQVVITFTPSAPGPASAELEADSAQGASAILNLSGNGVFLEVGFTPDSLDFGEVEVGTGSPVQTAMLENTGEVDVSELTFIPAGAGFVADTSDCGSTLAAGASCQIAVHFSPAVAGPAGGELQAVTVQGASAVLELAGTGLEPPPPVSPDLSFDPASLDFGEVNVGATGAAQTAVLENTGNADATSLVFTTPGTGFTADTSDCGDTLPAGQSCTVSLSFTPAAPGPANASLKVNSGEGVTATLGTRSTPDQYLYHWDHGMGSVVRLDPADPASRRAVYSFPANELGFRGRGFAVDVQNCAYYWAPQAGVIRRASIDGSDEGDISIGVAQGMEIDAASNTLYWGGSSLSRAVLGPTGLGSVESLVPPPSGQNFSGLALDVAGNRVYWSTGGQPAQGGIWRAALDGSGVEQIVQAAVRPQGLALDLNAGKVYWGDGYFTEVCEEGECPRFYRIHRANLDGTNPEMVLEVPSSGNRHVAHLAVDSNLGKLFWSINGLGFYSANLDGTGFEELLSDGRVDGFDFVPGDIDERCGPPAADICPPGGDCNGVEAVYWTESNSGGGSMWRANADGSYREMIHEWTSGVAAGLITSRETGRIYWHNPTFCQVHQANLDGTDAELMLQLPCDRPSDGSPTPSFGGRLKLDLTTGTMLIGQRHRHGFQYSQNCSTLWRVDLGNGDLEVHTVFCPPSPYTNILFSHVDWDTRLGYFGSGDTLYRFDIDAIGGGSEPELVASGLPQGVGCHLPDPTPQDAKQCYWPGYRMDLDGTNVEELTWWDQEIFRLMHAIDGYSGRQYGTGVGTGPNSGGRSYVSRWDMATGKHQMLARARPGPTNTPQVALFPALHGGSSSAALILTGVGIGPAIDVDPASFSVTLPQDGTAVEELTIDNLGGGVLDWTIQTAEPVSTGQSPASAPAAGPVSSEGVVDAIDLAAVLGESLSAGLRPVTPAGGVVDCGNEPGIIIHDDGSIENGYTFETSIVEARFVDYFIPQSYPASFRAVCVALLSLGPTAMDFEIVVYADDGPGGAPGTELGALAVTATNIPVISPPLPPGLQPTWYSYDISSLDIGITSGGAYIGIRYAPLDGIYIPADQSPGNPVGHAGGYLWSNGLGSWAPIEAAFASYRALFVRAVESEPAGCHAPDDIAWLSVNPDSGSTGSGGSDTVQISVNAAGLAPGDHEALLCIASNDLDNPLVAVPISLTVEEPPPVPGELSVDPTELDFGELDIGETDTLSLTISNTAESGAEALELSVLEITTGEPEFQLTGGDCDTNTVLEPEESCTVEVTFQPGGEGAFDGVVTVETTDGQSMAVELLGSGTEEPKPPEDEIFHDRFEEGSD